MSLFERLTRRLGLVAATPRDLLVQLLFQRKLEEVAPRHLHGRLIDIGCATKPYAALLAPLVKEHVGVDHAGSLHDRSRVDVEGTAYDLPVPTESFDSALCTAVLEHLEEPELALRECHRVLRPGAVALYSVPFIWHLHEEPRDFYRFSKHGLRYLFEKTGFEVVELHALSGFWATFGQLLVYNLYRFHRGVLRRLHVVPVLGLAIQLVSLALDRIDRTERWTWMYMVAARRVA